MTSAIENTIGYLKYDGELVEAGILDARTAATALLGFDRSLRHFVSREDPELGRFDFQIPVKVQHGSWIALIPDTVGGWVMDGLGIALTAYLTSAATKLAENDFKDKKLKDVFIEGLKAIQWIIRVGKHLGTLTNRRLTGLRWRNENTEVGIPNENLEYLYIPKHYFQAFLEAPSNILQDIASIVEGQRVLTIAVVQNNIFDTESISIREKHIFYVPEKTDEEILFPELHHGQNVELDGVVTRGNEVSNSIGFRYNEHILTCYPQSGSVVRFKKHLFLPCRIIGVISRADGSGGTNDPRPKIRFDGLIILSDTPTEADLFPDEEE